MSYRTASTVPAVALSIVVTLALLLGIDTLAVQQHAGAEMAAAAAASQVAAAKAPRPRS